MAKFIQTFKKNFIDLHNQIVNLALFEKKELDYYKNCSELKLRKLKIEESIEKVKIEKLFPLKVFN